MMHRRPSRRATIGLAVWHSPWAYFRPAARQHLSISWLQSTNGSPTHSARRAPASRLASRARRRGAAAAAAVRSTACAARHMTHARMHATLTASDWARESHEPGAAAFSFGVAPGERRPRALLGVRLAARGVVWGPRVAVPRQGTLDPGASMQGPKTRPICLGRVCVLSPRRVGEESGGSAGGFDS